ncbi:unnamed protein product, partial [Effrenium voratum]
ALLAPGKAEAQSVKAQSNKAASSGRSKESQSNKAMMRPRIKEGQSNKIGAAHAKDMVEAQIVTEAMGALTVGGVNKAAIGAALGKDKAQSNKAASGGRSKEEDKAVMRPRIKEGQSNKIGAAHAKDMVEAMGALTVGGVNKAAIGAALGKDKVEAQSNKAASGGRSKGQSNKAVMRPHIKEEGPSNKIGAAHAKDMVEAQIVTEAMGAVGGVNKAAIGAALGKDKVEAQSNKAASGGINKAVMRPRSKEEGQSKKIGAAHAKDKLEAQIFTEAMRARGKKTMGGVNKAEAQSVNKAASGDTMRKRWVDAVAVEHKD